MAKRFDWFNLFYPMLVVIIFLVLVLAVVLNDYVNDVDDRLDALETPVAEEQR